MRYFEWDDEKAASNEMKHGVRFADAAWVFEVGVALTEPHKIVDGELRWRTIGFGSDGRLLFVAHTLEDDDLDEVIRMISARKAEREERDVMGNIVRKTMAELMLDRESSEHRLAAPRDIPDEEIDFSDIPPAMEDFWQNARPVNEVLRERRAMRMQKTLVHIDPEVCAWLKGEDGGIDESRMNLVLREAMVRDAELEQKRA
jgi:uncharacterized DUF497 family protein/uncharacterized protein (DUF4415 family)